MPALKNPKHEIFAQALAKGMSQVDAYEAAGYEPDMPNAQRLTRNDKVQTRVRELQGRAAARAEISVVYLTEKLLALAKAAEDIAQSPAAIQAALASYMGAAKLNGLVVEKTETRTVRARDMSDDELATIARGGGRVSNPKTVN